ncbi:MAG: MFS transporter [Halanaerobiales bacterium]|nr:MFS transporter [Halanaerobiales bacterium]
MGLLKNNSNYRKIIISQSLSRFGDNIEFIALLLLVFKLTNSPISMGLIAILSTIPNICLTAIGGVFADRYSRKKIMFITDICRGLTILSVPIAFYFNVLTHYHLYIVTFVVSIFESINSPAQGAVVPSIVSKEELIQANSLLYSFFQVVGIIGLAGGGFFVGMVGFIGAFVFDALTFFCSASVILTMKIPSVVRKQEINKKQSILTDLFEGIKVVKNSKILVFAAVIFFYLGLMCGPFDIVVPFFVKLLTDDPGSQSTYIGLIFGSLSIGVILGTIVVKKINEHLPMNQIILLCSIILSIFYIILSKVFNVYIMCLVMLLFGIFVSVMRISVISEAYKNVIDEYRGRFSSLIRLIALSSNPFMAFFSSILLSYIGLGKFYYCLFAIGFMFVLGFIFYGKEISVSTKAA